MYTLPASWRQHLHLQGGSVYIQCQNLFTITKYKGMDPENQNASSLPPLRILTAGIRIEL